MSPLSREPQKERSKLSSSLIWVFDICLLLSPWVIFYTHNVNLTNFEKISCFCLVMIAFGVQCLLVSLNNLNRTLNILSVSAQSWVSVDLMKTIEKEKGKVPNEKGV